MHRIAGVLLALEPVARYFRDHDFAEAVFPGERLPYRQFGHWLRAHIGEEEAGDFPHRIGVRRAAFSRSRLRVDDIVVGLFEAAAGFVHEPAMIVAADSPFLDKP